MNKERFHNFLALSLGYDRIINSKGVSIAIDDKDNPDDPMVIIKTEGDIIFMSFNVSQISNIDELDNTCGVNEEIKYIIDAVSQAYNKATTKEF